MNSFLGKVSYFGSHLIVILGIIILLIENDTGVHPHTLARFTLVLVFILGSVLLVYIIRNRGIK